MDGVSAPPSTAEGRGPLRLRRHLSKPRSSSRFRSPPIPATLYVAVFAQGETPMPLDFCHPEAPHKKLRMPEWYVSSLMMDRALDAVVRRVKHLDRKHDIPYLAGYSLDGNTIYIDRHMPQSFKFRGRVIETDRFLLLHEEVEKTLIDRLGLHYLHAHQIATRAEQAAVRAAGVSWRAYDRFMQKNVKRDGDERLSRCRPIS